MIHRIALLLFLFCLTSCVIFPEQTTNETEKVNMFVDAGEREALLRGMWQTEMSLDELKFILNMAGDGDVLRKTGEPDNYYFDRFYNDRRIRYTFWFRDDKLCKWSEDIEWFK